jgi:competence protein ComGC
VLQERESGKQLKPVLKQVNRLRTDLASRAGGFTFVEMLAVIMTCSLLISLSVPAIVRARQKSVQDLCLSNLRQIGVAVQMYSDDNQGSLPGPVSALVQPSYDITTKKELAWFLTEQLDLPKPSASLVKADFFICHASQGLTEENAVMALRKSFVLNDAVSLDNTKCATPFGRPANPMRAPLKLSTLAASVPVAKVWAIADADKGNVNPKLAGWNELPYRPIHGEVRDQLYFDWHVAAKRW